MRIDIITEVDYNEPKEVKTVYNNNRGVKGTIVFFAVKQLQFPGSLLPKPVDLVRILRMVHITGRKCKIGWICKIRCLTMTSYFILGEQLWVRRFYFISFWIYLVLCLCICWGRDCVVWFFVLRILGYGFSCSLWSMLLRLPSGVLFCFAFSFTGGRINSGGKSRADSKEDSDFFFS